MSQMGFMLVQCALGVYSAAIIHLILHGVFKATLFYNQGQLLNASIFQHHQMLSVLMLGQY